MFLVIQGEGWVHSEGREPTSVVIGDAVFWDTDELELLASSEIISKDSHPVRFLHSRRILSRCFTEVMRRSVTRPTDGLSGSGGTGKTPSPLQMTFINGIILLLLGIIFLRLYFRYKNRNYFLLALVLMSSALQMSISEVDVFFPEGGESGIFNLLATIFGMIMILLLITIIVFPGQLSVDFAEEFFPDKKVLNSMGTYK